MRNQGAIKREAAKVSRRLRDAGFNAEVDVLDEHAQMLRIESANYRRSLREAQDRIAELEDLLEPAPGADERAAQARYAGGLFSHPGDGS